MPDIIFIGAGPVGLLGAIQLKLQCPDRDIVMFEKYEQPQRHHAMYVEQSSFAGMKKDNGFGKLLESIPQKIIISDLEKLLREYAVSIGIKIDYREVRDFNELKSLYPDTNYYVGSGGLKGIVHPQIFEGENQIDVPIRHAIEVKYKATGVTRALNRVTELPGVLAYVHHTVSEYVGHFKDDFTPVSLRIFIDESTHAAMKTATFKAPWTLADKDRIPDALFKTISIYLNGRKNLAGEEIAKHSLKISTITLSIYASKYFCKQIDGKTYFQIGEEGFACPFYRSFNDNASCIPFFTRAMKALFDNQQVREEKSVSGSLFKSHVVNEDPVAYYQKSLQKFVNSEIKVVYFLNAGLDCIESSVGTSQIYPEITASKLNLKGERGKAFLAAAREEHGDVRENDESENLSSWPCTLL